MEQRIKVICTQARMHRFLENVIAPLARDYARALSFNNYTLSFNKEHLNHNIFLNHEPLFAIKVEMLSDEYWDMASVQISLSNDFCVYIETEHEQTFRDFIRNQLS